MLKVVILAQSLIDEGFCGDGSFGCWAGYGAVGLAIVALGLFVGRSKRRSEEAYWLRKQREADMRAGDPDMAPPETTRDGSKTVEEPEDR